jgi:hypothetical protein
VRNRRLSTTFCVLRIAREEKTQQRLQSSFRVRVRVMRAFCYCDGFFRLLLPSDSAHHGKIHERVQASRVRELSPIEGKFLGTEIALFRSV